MWPRQWQDLLDTMLRLGIKNPEQILQPLPMHQILRAIGGNSSGLTARVSTDEKSVYLGGQRYDRRTLKFTTPTVSYSEEALVYAQLGERQALEALVRLAMPQLPVAPTFKSFSIDDSSAVDEIRYDSKLQILEIELAGGNTYRYSEVPAYLVGEFLFTPSKGEFYNSRIKGKYGSQKV